MTTGKILFEEWARDDHTAHPLLGQLPGPCPVCGHPTNACTDHTELTPMADKKSTKTDDTPDTSAPANAANAPSETPKGTGSEDGRLPGTTAAAGDARAPGESTEPIYLDAPHADAGKISLTFEDGYATLDQDTYEQVDVPRAETPTYRLVGRKGQRVRA